MWDLKLIYGWVAVGIAHLALEKPQHYNQDTPLTGVWVADFMEFPAWLTSRD